MTTRPALPPEWRRNPTRLPLLLEWGVTMGNDWFRLMPGPTRDADIDRCTGKHLVFSCTLLRLMQFAENECLHHRIVHAKVSTPSRARRYGFEEHVLCLYDTSPERSPGIQTRASVAVGLRYAGWKSDDKTRSGLYSQGFLSRIPPGERELFTVPKPRLAPFPLRVRPWLLPLDEEDIHDIEEARRFPPERECVDEGCPAIDLPISPTARVWRDIAEAVGLPLDLVLDARTRTRRTRKTRARQTRRGRAR